MQGYLREGDVLFVDNGTSYALFGLKFPPNCTFVGSVNWGSIGYWVGPLLDALTAAPARCHILFVGDGSFHVTARGTKWVDTAAVQVQQRVVRARSGTAEIGLPTSSWRTCKNLVALSPAFCRLQVLNGVARKAPCR